MKIKCPSCEDVAMELQEDKHVCPECDKELSLTEATDLFEAGEVVALVEATDEEDDEEEVVASSDDDEASDDEDEDDVKKEADDTAKLSVMMSEYGVVSKILRAGKKDQLSEEWVQDLVEALAEGTDINVHKVDVASLFEWAESIVADQAVVSEDLVKALATDDTISEEIKSDVVVVFEAAIAMRTKQINAQLSEDYDLKLAEAEQTIRGTVEEEVDGYLDVVVTEWMTENKLAVESGIKTDMVESFMDGLKELFEDHYIEVPEGKDDVLEALAAQVQELEEEIVELNTAKDETASKVVEMKAEAVLNIVAEDLADTQKEKLAELAESVEFIEEDAYAAKLQKLKESFLSEAVVESDDETTVVVENVDDEDEVKAPASQFDYITKAVNNLSAKV